MLQSPESGLESCEEEDEVEEAVIYKIGNSLSLFLVLKMFCYVASVCTLNCLFYIMQLVDAQLNFQAYYPVFYSISSQGPHLTGR